MRARGVVYFLCGMLCCAAAIQVAPWGVGLARHLIRSRSMDFDSERWKASPPTYTSDSLRLRMVDDLLDEELLMGRTESQVVELLGPPDARDFITGHGEHYDLIYELGSERGTLFAMDWEVLILKLDAAGQVVATRTYH